MLDHAGLEAVFAVIEESAFDRAAIRLGITPSAVSHRVKTFEERIGAALIVRGTPCLPTDVRRKVHRHIERVHLLEAALRNDHPGLLSESGQGRRVKVRVVVNADSLSTWCLGAFSDFTERTAYLVDVSTEDQDFALEWLARGDSDAAITASGVAPVGCDAHALGALRYRATASPAFIARYFGKGVTADALARAPSLTFNRKDTLQKRWSALIFGERIEHPTHFLPSSNAFVEACLRGMGWGLNPETLVQEHLTSGALVELVPDRVVDTALFWQINRLSADLLGDLTAAIVQRARDNLVQGGGFGTPGAPAAPIVPRERSAPCPNRCLRGHAGHP